MLERDGRQFLVRAARQLRRHQLRRAARDDAAPAQRARPVRRRRALRPDLRRQHADLSAHPLGARPHARRAHPARAARCACRPATPPPSTVSHDRGTLEAGKKGDVNVIDHDALQLHAPEMVFDLPGGGRRLIQRVDGYRFTVVSGAVTFEDGEPTGAQPGTLVRGHA